MAAPERPTTGERGVELDLAEVEIEPGVEGGLAVARWVDELRARMQDHGRVRVCNCPQLLAHTLYKAGLLRDGRLELVDVREEEPYG